MSETKIAVCITCGCADDCACRGGCYWLRVDRKANVGVCSQCQPDVKRWDLGDRALAVRHLNGK